MTEVVFSKDIAYDEAKRISPATLEMLRKAGEASNNPSIRITSVRRTPARQAEAMFTLIKSADEKKSSGAKRVAYGAAGKEVEAVYDKYVSKKPRAEVVQLMEAKIAELIGRGMTISNHCVSAEAYAGRNIVDITTTIPNPRDFVRALVQLSMVEYQHEESKELTRAEVVKVITPFSSSYGSSKVTVSPSELAIHVEIRIERKPL